MNQIDLLTQKKIIEKIVKGERTEDYRRLSKFSALHLAKRNEKDGRYYPRTDLDRVRFVAGYKKDGKFAIVEVKLIEHNVCGQGHAANIIPEGFSAGDHMLRIILGKVLEHNL